MHPEELNIQLESGEVGGLVWRSPGHETPIIALHGWLDNAATFIPVFSKLTRNVRALDFPGHGNTYHLPAGSRYNFIDYIPFVRDVIEKMGFEKIILCGHSMGAGVSSLLAALLPDQVEKLILIEGLGPLSQQVSEIVEQGRKALKKKPVRNARRRRGYPDFESAVAARAAVGDIAQSSARLLVERNLKRRGDEYFWKYDSRLREPSLLRLTEEMVREYLKSIECPILLISGRDVNMHYADIFRRRIEVLKDCRHFDLPGGHHLHMDNPEPIAEKIVEFLD